VILIILAQESLELGLRLKRYGKRIFGDLFVILKVFRVNLAIIFKFQGSFLKIEDCGLILEKHRGSFVKR
jgi:hypothetical protein